MTAGTTDNYPKVHAMEYPKVRRRKKVAYYWREPVFDRNATHQVVPLGGIHLYRDENGEWEGVGPMADEIVAQGLFDVNYASEVTQLLLNTLVQKEQP